MTDRAVLYNPADDCWLHFHAPVEVIAIHEMAEVLPALQAIEDRCRGERLYAAGFVSYEAAPAFDPALQTHPPGEIPLLHFGLFRASEPLDLQPAPSPLIDPVWRPDLDANGFAAGVDRIKAAIAGGETYQVNFTFSLEAEFTADPWRFFRQLVQGQGAGGAGYLEAGRWAICSASPELFFERIEGELRMRPMKGTAPRGRTAAEDRRFGAALQASTKDRAENVMILDMVRNDLGRLAPPGGVRVPDLYTLEKYPTLWQLTSTASARSDASLAEIFQALFPCASITGAPKARTMQIIRELETRPREIYTGAFGWLAPDGSARFSVAIRTVSIDRQRQLAHYGVGAGITWGSEAEDEYRECLAKAKVLEPQPTGFRLLETLRWTPRHGYFLLDEHLQRLAESADYFDFPCDRDQIASQMEACAAQFPAELQRVRLLLDRTGFVELQADPLPASDRLLRLRLAAEPVDPADRFLYHKTTQRNVYDLALAGAGNDCDDVILWNPDRQVTETCLGNLVLDLDGRLVTPPVACGLLAGTYRTFLLARGVLHEETISVDDLLLARAVYRINAVRKWQRAEFIGPA